ncbi:uncharacterized protein CDV56_102617 [Aspergillus thermomutatus]|uniref:Uncharacterized protein n=1 Tax=Aspergillus thermomutatus TaxID=41047 RepID=A0A397GI74_ASPTH|nr:uncharacterized protein CDV56_102617 [Aspergillus thermomutatus]RHZ49444.1 hypothetical protein CDV56_102617 [Aspergillus thermomutatus]
MRTRSQPLSPGGLVALESEPRRTRSTRTASLRQGSAEPASQPTTRSTRSASLRQPSAEPATQSTTRSTRSASLRQPSAEPATEPSTRSTRRARTRQSSAEPSTQSTSSSRSRRAGNGVITSIEEAPTTQTRARKTSTRRSTRQSTRKTSDDETEPIDTEQVSQPESIVDETSAAQEPPEPEEPIPSVGEHALSEPKASDSELFCPFPEPVTTPEPYLEPWPSSPSLTPSPSPPPQHVPSSPLGPDPDFPHRSRAVAPSPPSQHVPSSRLDPDPDFPHRNRAVAPSPEAQSPQGVESSKQSFVEDVSPAPADTWMYDPLEDISDIGSPLSERSHTPDLEMEDLFLGFELDESLLADIGACLGRHNQVELAAAHNAAGDDLDSIMADECGSDANVVLLSSEEYNTQPPAVTEASTVSTTAERLVLVAMEGIEFGEERDCRSPMSVCGQSSWETDSISMVMEDHTATIDVSWISSGESSREGSLSPLSPVDRDEEVPIPSIVAAVSSSIDNEVAALIQSFSGLCLADTAYDDTPAASATPLLCYMPASTGQVQQDATFDVSTESGTTSTLNDGRLVSAKVSELIPGPSQSRPAAAEVDKPRQVRRSATEQSARWARVALSPIPEESEVMSPRSGLGVGANKESVDSPSTSLSAAPHLLELGSRGVQAEAQEPAKEETRLTPRKVNRKRPRDDGAETPSSNKRRNVGPPGSTPFARRMTPLSRRITYNAAPYSERLRRRTIESQGRIHKTVFRLPQLLAQNEADRRAAESTPLNPCPEPVQTNTESAEEQSKPDDQDPSDGPATAQPPSTPQARGWNIRGLINSVPRSFSRLLPRFGRSSQTSEAPDAAPSPTPQLPSEPSSQPLSQEPSVSSSHPLPERTSRTKVRDSNQNATQSDRRSRRRLSEQPPSKRKRTLSYSLFPAPIDRARFLGDLITPKKTSQAVQPESRPEEAEKPSGAQDQPSSTSQVTDVSQQRVSRQTTEDSTQKKRKRSPSPDVIPNPAGCSYGLDLDYFCYSSDSEEEADVQPQQAVPPTKPDTLVKSAVRSAMRSEHAPSKRVRFDASPEDTPSKLRTRPRATDPYLGRHFVGMGDAARVTAPGSPAAAPATPTPAARVDLSTPQQSPGFIPNKQGTFQLDYDAFSDDTDSSGAPSPNPPAATPVSETQITSTRTEVQESVQSPAPRPTPRQALPPSTPAKVDQEALARVRSQAEKYKPKTPSGLRTASRYSSPLTASPVVNQQPPVETFGDDDQFARDAQWLFEHCSSGDLHQLQWPESNNVHMSLGVDDEIVGIIASVGDASAVDEHPAFHQSLEEFTKTLA